MAGNHLTIVGECDPRGGEPLDRRQPGRSGARLASILGLPAAEYDASRRMNLCRVAWSRPEASATWSAAAAAGVVVVLGRRAASVVSPGAGPFSVTTVGQLVVVCLPHPSGLCRVWNDRANFNRARRLLSAARRIADAETR